MLLLNVLHMPLQFISLHGLTEQLKSSFFINKINIRKRSYYYKIIIGIRDKDFSHDTT